MLLGLVLIDGHEVLSNIVLNVIWYFQTVHSCISVIQALLEVNVFLVHFLHEYSHLPKNGSVDDCGANHHDNDDRALNFGSGTNFIQTKDHNGMVAHGQVLLGKLVALKQFGLCINIINLWNPSSVLRVTSKHEPKEASKDMNVTDQVEHHFHYFKHCFCFLSIVQISNDFTNSEYSYYFENGQDTESLDSGFTCTCG